MKLKTYFKKYTAVIFILAFIALILADPEVCTSGVAEGIIISGRIIIPSLFPFTACVLFLSGSGALSPFRYLSPVTKRIFNINGELFAIMLLSCIGGYPIGAKLLNEAVDNKKISPENAGIMLNYCVNAGPAFVIIAVGSGVLGSKPAGTVLFAAHLASSLIIGVLCGFFIKPQNGINKQSIIRHNAADCFVYSVSSAASSVLGICGYVIFFSAVNAYLNCYSENFPFLKYAKAFFEVTNAVYSAKSIEVMAFLLGFAGISIWCQVLSVGKSLKINLFVFAAVRAVHGAVSAIITRLLIKIFNITVFVSSAVRYKPFYGGGALGFSMLVMVIILIISIFNKKSTGKILDDIV